MAKVNPGDPLRIAAADWNTLLDVADAAKLGQLGGNLAGRQWMTQRGVIVPVRNDTGSSVDRYHAMAVGDPVFSPTDNEQTFLNQLVMQGETASASYIGKFAVAQETIGDGKIGHALLQGITAAEITVNHADHNRVDIDTTGGSKLESQFYGAGEILYKQSGTGTKWAIIRVGSFVSEQLKATADENIACTGYGDATIQINGSDSETVTVYLNWLCGTVGVSTDDELLVRFYRDENRYVIEGAECP